jgi:hypothetical protein
VSPNIFFFLMCSLLQLFVVLIGSGRMCPSSFSAAFLLILVFVELLVLLSRVLSFCDFLRSYIFLRKGRSNFGVLKKIQGLLVCSAFVPFSIF